MSNLTCPITQKETEKKCHRKCTGKTKGFGTPCNSSTPHCYDCCPACQANCEEPAKTIDTVMLAEGLNLDEEPLNNV